MLGLYAALLGPELPQTVRKLFENTIFKMVILFLVVVRGNKNPQMALMIAVAYVLTLEYLQKQDVISGFASISSLGNDDDDDERISDIEAQFTENFDGALELDTFETVENLNEIEAMANVEFADEDGDGREDFGDVEDTDGEYELFSEDDEEERFTSEDDEQPLPYNYQGFANDEEDNGDYTQGFANDEEDNGDYTQGFANDEEDNGDYTQGFANDEEDESLPYNYEGFGNNEDDDEQRYYSM
jgi:hypothetical protein